MIARWGPIVVLLLLIIASAWLLKELDDERKERGDSVEHVPDIFLEGFSTTTMDETGKPKRRLSAEYMAHFPDTDTNELEKPYLVVFQALGGDPLHVRAERGWVSGNDEVMLLLGEVQIWRDTPEGVRELEITTRDLRVLPESSYGETDKSVVIRTPTSESRGVGMRAYLGQRRVELLSRVRTVYEKN